MRGIYFLRELGEIKRLGYVFALVVLVCLGSVNVVRAVTVPVVTTISISGYDVTIAGSAGVLNDAGCTDGGNFIIARFLDGFGGTSQNYGIGQEGVAVYPIGAYEAFSITRTLSSGPHFVYLWFECSNGTSRSIGYFVDLPNTLVYPVEESNPVCGDGVIDVGEECDDDNDVNGDGCDSECKVEVGFICKDMPSECLVIEHLSFGEWLSMREDYIIFSVDILLFVFIGFII